MAKKLIASAIVLTDRGDVRNAIRNELRKNGIEGKNLHSCKTVQEIRSRIANTARAFLVLDWDSGADKILEVLESNREGHRVESHPVFLVSSSEDPAILSAALEFNVAKVHTGEIAGADIKDIIRDLVRDAANLGPLRTLLLRVSDCFASNNPGGALEILRPLYEKQKNNPRVVLELAECYMQLGQWDEAKRILQDLTEDDKNSARARHQLARCCMKLGEMQEASKYLNQAKLINPMNISRLLELGDVLLAMEEPKAAARAFGDVMDIAPKNKEAIAGKGKSLLLSGDINDALGLLHGSSTARDTASIFNTAAIMAIQQKRFNEGIELYKTGIRTVADNKKLASRLMFNMGIGFVKSVDVRKGMSCFKKAVELDPKYEDAIHNLDVLEKAVASGGVKSRPKPLPKVSGEPDVPMPPVDTGISQGVDEGEGGIVEIGNLEESLGGIGSGGDMSSFNFDGDFDLGLDDDEF